MIAQWKKFDGSEEQLNEIKGANKNGWMVKWRDGTVSDILDERRDDHVYHLVNWSQVSEYFICNRHPHADMIIEWARTGREVYVLGDRSNRWILCVNDPAWNPESRYSFNPDGDSK